MKQYEHDGAPGDVTNTHMNVFQSDNNGTAFTINGEGNRGHILVKSSDIPRLIAQLTAALPGKPSENSEPVPDEDTTINGWSIQDGTGSTMSLDCADGGSVLVATVQAGVHGMERTASRATLSPARAAKLAAKLNEYATLYGKSPTKSTEKPPADTMEVRIAVEVSDGN